MRIASLLLALGVALGSGFAIRTSEAPPDLLGEATLNQVPPDAAKAVSLYTEALRRDPANPQRWDDLGFAFETADDLPKARYCYSRALELSGELPLIWLRDVNFHFTIDEPDNALRTAARVLKTVPDYDDALFGYFDRFGLSPSSVLSEIGEDRRAARAYAQHLIDIRKPDQAEADQVEKVWQFAFAKGYVDQPLANSYVDAMLLAHRCAQARHDWVQYLGSQSGGYPDQNLIFNPGFEQEPTGSAFDWQIQSSGEFNTSRDDSNPHEGKFALRIQFQGSGNVSYQNVIQKTCITPGNYALRAWIRTTGITTNEGPRIQVADPDSPSRLSVSTESFLGTSDWQPVTVPFKVSTGTSLIAIRVIRQPSSKFDNKISGSFWIDALSLSK